MLKTQLVMATLQELKSKIKFNSNNQTNTPLPSTEDKEETINQLFEIEEARYMLNLIANSDFKGRDIQIVYNIALKLQNTLQTIND